MAEAPLAIGQVFNIGSTEEVTILKLARKVLDIVNDSNSRLKGHHYEPNSSDIELTEDDKIIFMSYDQVYESGFEEMLRRVLDISKIISTIGWKPQITLDEIPRRVIAFHRTCVEL